jgi:hypothetical protein
MTYSSVLATGTSLVPKDCINRTGYEPNDAGAKSRTNFYCGENIGMDIISVKLAARTAVAGEETGTTERRHLQRGGERGSRGEKLHVDTSLSTCRHHVEGKVNASFLP